MKANRSPDKQNLFPIVQGGFDVQLRETSMQQVRGSGAGLQQFCRWTVGAIAQSGTMYCVRDLTHVHAAACQNYEKAPLHCKSKLQPPPIASTQRATANNLTTCRHRPRCPCS